MNYLLKPVSDWTEEELRKALAAHEAGYPRLQYSVLAAVKARIETLDARKQLVIERTAMARQKRLLMSFVDTSKKPKGSIDIRSVKHAAIDASRTKGPKALTLAMAAAGYEWLVRNGLLPKAVPAEWQSIVVIAALTFAAGWVLIGFAVRLTEKWEQEF